MENPIFSRYQHRCLCKYHQCGYATVLTIVLFSVLSLSLLAMFNSGQIVTHKLKLQNAVDAAAYSTAIISSREMNYMAYTNRAMIANQVMVGQIVGLASWTKMMKESSVNLEYVGDLVSAIPYVGQLIASYLKGLRVVSNAAENAVSKFINPSASPLTNVIFRTNTVIKALSVSQDTVHLATQGLIAVTFPKVLKDNDPDAVMAAVGGAVLLNQFRSKMNDFSKRTDESRQGSNDLGRFDKFAKTVKDSRDEFTEGRSYTWLEPPPIPFLLRVWIRKKGGNEFDRKLDNGKYVWEWSAMDTVSLWTEVFSYDPKDYGWQGENEVLPIGWGAAHTSKKIGDYDNYHSGYKWGRARENAIAGQFAESDYGNNRLASTSGLQRFFYMNDNKKRPTPPVFIAFAAKDSGSVRTWKEIIKANGGQVDSRFDVEEKGNLVSSKMYSLAKSEPYFSRSYDLADFKRGDSYEEYGNLFNPYWQARLVALTSTELSGILLLLPK